MVGDTHFERYIPESSTELVEPEKIRRHILCTGKDNIFLVNVVLLIHRLGQVYYNLLQEREEKGIKDVAISRLEQISPFPYDLVGVIDFSYTLQVILIFSVAYPTLGQVSKCRYTLVPGSSFVIRCEVPITDQRFDL